MTSSVGQLTADFYTHRPESLLDESFSKCMCTLENANFVATLLKGADNNDVLAYWLCNTSTLLMLLQHTLKASGAASLTPQRRRSSSASLFGRMSQVCTNTLYLDLPSHWNMPPKYSSLVPFTSLFEGIEGIPAECWIPVSQWKNAWETRRLAASWGKISCFVVQAAAHCFSRENIWNDQGQSEERDFPFAWFMHPGKSRITSWSTLLKVSYILRYL